MTAFLRDLPTRPVPFRWRDAAGVVHDDTLHAPGVYPRVHAAWALLAADLTAVRRLLPTGLRPIRLSPRHGVVAVHLFRYADSPVGPYDEVSVSVAVRPPGGRLPSPLSLTRAALTEDTHGFVVQLPVSTEVAWRAGVDLFGYPKLLTAIAVEEGPGGWRATVRDPAAGTTLYTLRGAALTPRRPGRVHTLRRLGRQVPHGPARRVVCNHSYPVRDGVLHHARMHLHLRTAATAPGHRFGLELGDDPRVEPLRSLRLTPILYAHAPEAEALLELPTPL